MIDIALTIHDRTGEYARHVGATMASVFASTGEPVCAHVLHDHTLTTLNRKRLELIAQAAGQAVVFYPVRLPQAMEAIETGPFTQGSLYRLLMPELLPVARVLYMDCDVIVDLDVAELWNESLRGHLFAAVRDRGVKELDRDHQRRLCNAGLSLDHYFNSGVMLFDLERIRREQDLVGGFLNFWNHFPESMMPDQDFLNWTFQGEYCRLQEKYNTLVKCEKNWDCKRGKIWHFSGMKPWMRYETELDAKYWRALALTPWRDQAMEALLGAVDAKMQQLLNSRSWRMTRPFREIGDWARSLLVWLR